MRSMIFLLVLSALGLPSGGQAQTTVLEPTSTWDLNYSKDKCRLVRTFGTGEAATVLVLDQLQPHSSFHWVVAGDAIEQLRLQRRVNVQFGSNFASQDISTKNKVTYGNFGEAIMSWGYKYPEKDSSDEVPENRRFHYLDVQEGEQIDWLEIRRNKKIARLNTGSLGGPFKALNDCMDDLIAHWGFDPDQQRSLVKAPNLTNSLEIAQRVQENYPSEALRNGEQGMINFRVRVSAEGRPQGCVLTNVTAGNFGEGPCAVLMGHAKFDPAEGVGGENIPSFFVSSIRYLIPD